MKYFFLLLLCLGLTQSISGQKKPKDTIKNSEKDIQTLKNRKVKESITNTYMVEYDFPSGIYRNNRLRPKVDFPIAFEIQNINRLAYNVSIKSKDSILSQSYMEDDIINFLEEYVKRNQIKENIQDDEVDITEKPVAATGDIVSEAKEFQEEEVRSLEESKELGKKIGGLEQEIKTLKLEISNKEAITEENIKLQEELKEKEKLVAQKQNELDLAQKKANELQIKAKETSSLKQQYYNNYQDFHKTFAEMREVYTKVQDIELLSEEIANIATNPFLTFAIFKKDYAENLQAYNRNLPGYIKLNREFKELYSTLNMKYADLQSDRSVLDSILNRSGRFLFLLNMDQIKKTADVMDKKVNELNVDELVKNSRRVYELLNSPNNYQFISTPIQPKNDVAVFEVNINKRAESDYRVDNTKEFKHAEFTRHGLRFDVSVGASISMHDNKYNLSLQEDKSGNQKIVISEDPLVTPSFVGFFTTSYRSSTHFTGGVSAGIGISADEGSFTFDNFFVGPSLIVGRYERVMLTAGATLKNLPKLNEFYESGNIVDDQLNIENVTRDAYRIGYFISVSYNLTKGIRDNIRRINSSSGL